MYGTNGLKEATPFTARVASNTLGVNIFTAPGKAMVGEGPRPFGSTTQDTKRYLQDFDQLQKTATSDHELFDQMTALCPHW